MKAFLKVLVLVVVAVVASGCATTYHSVLKPTDSKFRDIVKGNDMRVYVEHAELEDCLVMLASRESRCVHINTSTILVPALKSEGIRVVDNKENANVIVKLTHLRNGRGWDYATTTTKFDINDNVIKIIAKSYRPDAILVANKGVWDAGVKATEIALTRLLKHNKTCNNCTIEAKVSFSNGDGARILTYRDNIGF